MLNINPLLLVGGVIGAVTALLIFAYASVKDKKTAMGFERTMADGEILRRLFAYAKPYWAKFLLVLFLMLFSIAYDIISPLIVGAIEELVAADFALSRLFASVAVYAGVLVFSMASTYFQAVILQRVGQRIISDLREDLYYRLNVFPLRWTALWERPGDILPLAEHLLALHASQMGLPTPQLAEDARERLMAHPWPGNVRELDNVVQRALILCPDGLIDCEHLILEETDETLVRPLERLSGEGLGGELKQQEHQIILDTLQECNGSRKAVADKLGISPRTLRYKLAQMRDAGIELPA